MDNDVMIMNALDKEVHLQAFGNHFMLKAKQIKRFRGEIGDFLAKEKRYLGVVALPIEFEEPDYAKTKEGMAIVAEKIKEGINNRVAHLEWQKNNLLVSLQRDLDMKNIKVDPLKLATKGDISALEELDTLQASNESEAKAEFEKAKRLVEKLQKKV